MSVKQLIIIMATLLNSVYNYYYWLTQTPDDVEARGFHPSTQFLSDGLVGHHGHDPVELLKELLLSDYKPLTDVIAKPKPTVDDSVNQSNQKRKGKLRKEEREK